MIYFRHIVKLDIFLFKIWKSVSRLRKILIFIYFFCVCVYAEPKALYKLSVHYTSETYP